MKQYLEKLEQSPLFRGMASEDMEKVLRCLSATVERYPKNHFVLREGAAVRRMGVVLSGQVYVIREDFWGNRDILAKVVPGQLFAEAYACCPGTALRVSVVTEGEAAEVLFLNVQRVLTTCPSACPCHNRLVGNLLSILAGKNLLLNGKLSHVTRRTTREKLLSYLSAESQAQGSESFDIPFDRQQLADYLAVDRSAMSKELGRMRDEGLLQFQKNHFTLCQPWEQG